MPYTPLTRVLFSGEIQELGPATQEGDLVRYAYVQLVSGERAKNLVVWDSMDSVVKLAVGRAAQLHLLRGHNPRLGETHLLAAAQVENQSPQAVDIEAVGRDMVWVSNKGRLMKVAGAGLMVVGIPLIPAMLFGVLVIWGGWRLWKAGDALIAVDVAQRDLIDSTREVIAGLGPTVHLV